MRVALATISTVAILLATSLTAAAGEAGDFGRQLNAAACGTGRQVIDVSYRILNDDDSGYAGNAWAVDAIHRHVQVWQNGDAYCAVARDEGSFVTRAGASPDNTTTIAAGIRGEIEGGYRTTSFSGTLNGGLRMRGELGTYDFACDGHFGCPGYFSWVAHFFSATTGFDLAWWGWRYQAGRHGSWIDAVDVPQASAGDIR
ncbi:MAG: hypothetical protein KGK34_07520 [Chloroflexota bacterium]|nr:hypothetical protein [Chloroflexota bacterium]